MSQRNRQAGRKLLWLHQNFVTVAEPGNSRPAHQVAALLDAGWRVHVVAPRGGYMGSRSGPPPTRGSIPGLTVERIALSEDYSPFVNRHRTYIEFCLRALWRGLRSRNVDLIFSSTPPLPQTLPALLLSVWFNVPLVMEVRDLWPIYAIHCGRIRSRLLVFLMEWLESTANHSAHRILVTSPIYVDYLQRMGIRAQRIHCIPTGGRTDDPLAPEVRRRWRLQQGIAEDDVVLLYAGSFNETYDLQVFLDAAALLETEGARLVWVFAGNGRQVDLVRAAAARHRCIRLVGNLPRGELAELHAAADIGLVTHADVPILGTALSSKVFDYLAVGLPVLATTRGITAAVVRESDGGWVTRGCRSEDVAETVRAFLRLGPTGRKAMGRRGQTWVSTYASAPVLGARAVQVIRQAMQPTSRLHTAWRLCRSVFLGFRDALIRRSATSAAPFVNWPESNARRSLQDWMESSHQRHPVQVHRRARPRGSVSDAPSPGLFTIDVEDWFHPLLKDPDTWRGREDRLARPLRRLLHLLEATGNRATFFVLGEIAERHPELVREIVAGGHEVGCHGHHHLSLDRLDPRTFREDLKRGRDALGNAGASEVVSFRAPCFSLDESRLWALEVLADEGFRIDSSIFPLRTGYYGTGRSSNRPHWRGSILEVPLVLPTLAGIRLPLSGGFYARFFPHWLTEWGVRRVIAAGQRPVHYVHPWELDPEQPRLAVGRFLVFRHYLRLDRTEPLLRNLLERYRWQPLSDLFRTSSGRDEELVNP